MNEYQVRNLINEVLDARDAEKNAGQSQQPPALAEQDALGSPGPGADRPTVPPPFGFPPQQGQ